MPDTHERPHFVIFGAMKCATTTLHDQLARQPGVFMSTPKEPNFFSNDEAWSLGMGWYRALFDAAPPGAICGESSTHYSKLPTYPLAALRLHQHLPHARLIYVMRDPIDRIVSQYIHEWTVRAIDEPIDRAVRAHPELIDYSRYAMQLRPWLDRFGPERVLPVFFERVTARPQEEIERIARFIGYAGTPAWNHGNGARNISSERARKNPWRDRVLDIGLLKTARRALLSPAARERIKARWRMNDRPVLSAETRAWCAQRLEPDMRGLGELLGVPMSCDTYASAVTTPAASPDWAALGAGR